MIKGGGGADRYLYHTSLRAGEQAFFSFPSSHLFTHVPNSHFCSRIGWAATRIPEKGWVGTGYLGGGVFSGFYFSDHSMITNIVIFMPQRGNT